MNQTYKEAVASGRVEEHTRDVEALEEELRLLTLENIKRYPEYKKHWDDFYSMWQRFGPDAARTMLIPYIWRGKLPMPSVVVKARKELMMNKTLSKKVRRGEVELSKVDDYGRQDRTDVQTTG